MGDAFLSRASQYFLMDELTDRLNFRTEAERRFLDIFKGDEELLVDIVREAFYSSRGIFMDNKYIAGFDNAFTAYVEESRRNHAFDGVSIRFIQDLMTTMLVIGYVRMDFPFAFLKEMDKYLEEPFIKRLIKTKCYETWQYNGKTLTEVRGFIKSYLPHAQADIFLFHRHRFGPGWQNNEMLTEGEARCLEKAEKTMREEKIQEALFSFISC